MMKQGMRGRIHFTAAACACLALLSACGERAAQPLQGAPETRSKPEPTIPATGHVIEIRMMTHDPDNPAGLHVFSPRLVTAQVGDAITFVPADRTHSATSIEAMLPDGVEGWDGGVDEEVTYVIPKPGVYGFKCLPHYAAGMIGLIVVEGGDNIEAAKAFNHPGLAGREFAEIFAEAGL